MWGPAEDREGDRAGGSALSLDMAWTVYLARCRDGSLYTGITTDPDRRLAQHNAGQGAAYTRARLPVTLVYWEVVVDRSSALRREHAIKRLSRAAKEALAGRGTTLI
jgi:putative endonuclease